MKPLIRLVAILFSTILMTTLAHAQSVTTFGRTTAGTIPSGGLRADFKRGSKFVLSEPAVVTAICAYIDTNGGTTGSQSMRYSMYRDQNGVPGELVAVAGDYTVVSSQEPASWFCLGLNYGWVIAPGAYWLVIHTGGNTAGVLRYYYDGPANWYGNSDTFGGGSSESFGAGSAGQGTLSIHAQYQPQRYAGATTIGTRVSSPMSAQMKRGSSFVLTEKAMLWQLNAYIDGLGGTAGSQPLWLALYDDSNGEPSSLLAKGQVNGATAGSAAHWVSATIRDVFSPLPLMPGRYWIVLHTGGPAGVLRYYMQGTGNWRGNANPGTEPSQFFGAANAGDGTITANIVYTPADVHHDTFGRTTPGNIPSGPLTANYVRGSVYPPDHYFQRGWVTALWAYMDGNGGGSGSQKVQLGLYTSDIWQPTIRRLVTSEEITIPAGQAPGWVRFAVPRTEIHYNDYDGQTPYIMMFSGGAQGVARYYSSDDADTWIGQPQTYNEAGLYHSFYIYDFDVYPGAPILQHGTRTPSMYAEFVNTADTDTGSY